MVDPGEAVRFASDSPLEGDGFELPVPRSETMISGFAKGKEAAHTKGVRLERAAVEGE